MLERSRRTSNIKSFADTYIGAATSALRSLVPIALVVSTGCSTEEELSETYQAATVSTYITGTCSTAVVIGLSKQISDEIGCMSPTALVRFTPSTRVQVTSSAVLPYLGKNAKTAIEGISTTVQINSAFRTVAQQFLLLKWKEQGRCGISAAAAPGRSNHESGRALDLANWSSVRTAMSNRGWSWLGSGDPVHFDHFGSADIRGKDVLAFQRLWNRNNPNDRISEDGAYGPQTEARLRNTEATGFPVGATCVKRAAGADVVMIDGPDKMAPGTRGHMQITLVNTSDTDWPASTRLVIAGGQASPLFDQASWSSPTEIGTLGSDVGAGAMHVVELDIATPMMTEETALFTQVAISDGTTTFGTINLALTVTPNGDHDTSGDSDDEHDEMPVASGGCSTGGGLGWLALLLPAIVLGTRRRRR